MKTFRSHTIIHQLLSTKPFHPHLCPLKSHFAKEKGFLLWNFHSKVRQNLIQFEIYLVKYYCLHLAVIVHDFIRSVNQIFKAWIWTACKRLAFHCLCWIYGAPLAQILCSAWEHTRKYWFTLELIGIAAFGDIWILIALINLAIKTVNMLPTQKRFWSRVRGSFS